MSMTGKCLCGAVSFVAEDVKKETHACHCGMCRRWSGSPVFGVSVGKIQFSGEENISVYVSSDWAERGFCKTCGTNLFYRLRESGHHIVCAGSFDKQEDLPLVGEIYIDQKPAGYDFVGDHPRQTEREFLVSIGMA